YPYLVLPLFPFLLSHYPTHPALHSFPTRRSSDLEHLSLEVSCQAIPGYMDAMVMTFPVHNAEAIDGLAPGMMIDFKLDVRKDTVYADQIRVHAYENTAQEPMAARQLEILDAATGPPSRTGPALLVGQTVP